MQQGGKQLNNKLRGERLNSPDLLKGFDAYFPELLFWHYSHSNT